MRSKLKTYFGFAIRSNAAIVGTDQILAARKRLKLVARDAALSENAVKKLNAYCERKAIPIVTVEKLKELLNHGNIMAIGVTNENLAAAILTETQKGDRE